MLIEGRRVEKRTIHSFESVSAALVADSVAHLRGRASAPSRRAAVC